MKPIQLQEIYNLFGVSYTGEGFVDHIVTDSREVKENGLFVALNGENVDGHDYINQAFQRGAVLVLAEKEGDYTHPEKVILVENTMDAHIALGGLYRNKFQLPMVAITGSVGKTTTKEFVAAVLSGAYRTHKNQGNFNNELGLPKTLFALEDDHQVAVLEMGMSGLGEIEALSNIVKPVVGVITNIGLAHVELLGSQDNILKAKMEILSGMEKGAPLILWGDDRHLSQIYTEDYELIRYGLTNPNNQIQGSNIATSAEGTTFHITSPYGNFKAFIPTIGEHNVLNALAAFTVGVKMGIPPEKAVEYLANYEVAGMRQRMVVHHEITYVEDCYNCSPASLRASVVTLSNCTVKGRRILVLSDMLELGETAKTLHYDIGRFIATQNIDYLLTTGELAENYVLGADAHGMARAIHFMDKAALAENIKKIAKPGDMLWFKASRGMKLEEVLAGLYKEN